MSVFLLLRNISQFIRAIKFNFAEHLLKYPISSHIGQDFQSDIADQLVGWFVGGDIHQTFILPPWKPEGSVSNIKINDIYMIFKSMRSMREANAMLGSFVAELVTTSNNGKLWADQFSAAQLSNPGGRGRRGSGDQYGYGIFCKVPAITSVFLRQCPI